jgi:hypothetical protein
MQVNLAIDKFPQSQNIVAYDFAPLGMKVFCSSVLRENSLTCVQTWSASMKIHSRANELYLNVVSK